MSGQVVKIWTLGNRKVALMQSGAIRIVEATHEDCCFIGTDSMTDYTLATGLAGLIGLRDALTEVIDEVKQQRGIKVSTVQSAPEASEIKSLREYADACSLASGVFYEWDGGCQRGPIYDVVMAIEEGRRAVGYAHTACDEASFSLPDDRPNDATGAVRRLRSEIDRLKKSARNPACIRCGDVLVEDNQPHCERCIGSCENPGVFNCGCDDPKCDTCGGFIDAGGHEECFQIDEDAASKESA